MRLRSGALGNPALDVLQVESSLEMLDGVISVRINQKANSLVVTFTPESDARDKVLETLTDFTHSIFCVDDEIISPPDLVNVYWSGTTWLLKQFTPPTLKPAFATIGAAPVLMKGFETFVSKGLRVEVLDATVIAILLMRRDFFTVGSLNFLLNLGHYLEESTQYRSDKMLRNLVKPDISEVWILDGSVEKKVEMKDVRIGDFVIVGPGEMIPVDGALYQGEGSINQASITGESLPVCPAINDPIFSGTVVIEGKMIIKAEHVGADTTTARIAKFISNSLKNQSQTEAKAYRMADRLVPLTFGVGLATLALTKDVRRASSVLSVDYSCALKLVTPTSIKSSMYQAASEGIFIKGAQALENLSTINTMIFDKTGTLTKGTLCVTTIESYNEFTKDNVLKLAASAEEHYSHPMASAVVNEADLQGIELEETGEVDFIIAHGVSAYVGDHKVQVGSHHFIAEDEHIDCNLAEEDAQSFRKTGQSVLYVAVDNKLAGIIVVKDMLRDEAIETIAGLKEIGINRIVMLTGDHREAALHIAEQLGIEEVYFELKPEDKAEIVKQLKEEGCSIGFVGDGVNDAPALLSADVGISLPEGSDIAKETAQVILLRDDLRGLVLSKQIADNTMKVIKRMFYLNVGANSMTVLLSIMGLLSPLQSALLHNGTTVSSLIYALNHSTISSAKEN